MLSQSLAGLFSRKRFGPVEKCIGIVVESTESRHQKPGDIIGSLEAIVCAKRVGDFFDRIASTGDHGDKGMGLRDDLPELRSRDG